MLRLSDCVWFLVVSPHRGLQFLVSCLTVQLSLSWLCCLSGYRRNGTCDHTTPALKNWPWTMVMWLPGQRDVFLHWKFPLVEKLWDSFTAACTHVPAAISVLDLITFLGFIWGNRHRFTWNFLFDHIKSGSFSKSLTKYLAPNIIHSVLARGYKF